MTLSDLAKLFIQWHEASCDNWASCNTTRTM